VVCVRSQEHIIFRGKSKSGCTRTREINECDGTSLTDCIVQNPEIGWRIPTHKGGREEEAWVRQNERIGIVTRVKSTPKESDYKGVNLHNTIENGVVEPKGRRNVVADKMNEK